MLRGRTQFVVHLEEANFGLGYKPIAQGVEVANLPPTQITKLGCFYLAVGLQSLAGDGVGKVIARKFVAQMQSYLNPEDFEKYKISPAWMKGYDNPKINQGFVKSIKVAVKKIANDRKVSTDEISLLKFSVLFMEDPNKKPNYLDRAKKQATTISAGYYRNFLKVVDRISGTSAGNKSNVESLQTELSQVVSEILGTKPKKEALSVNNETIKNMRVGTGTNDDIDLARRYKELRRKLSLTYDSDLASYLSNGGGIVPIKDAYEHMVKLGYILHKLPVVTKSIPLKIGLYLGKVKYYTDDEKPLAQSIPSIAKNITFAKTYNKDDGTGAYLTYTSDMAAGITRVYTEQHLAKSASKISSATTAISTKIDSVLTRWKKDMTSADPIAKMGATAAVMIYLTAMRVGARQSSAASNTGVPTYGAISLRPRHITLRQGSISIKYKGKASAKSGVEQKHLIKVNGGDPLTKKLYTNLGQLLDGKKGDDLVFSMPGKRGTKPIILTYAAFNQYLRTSGYPAGIHKMRRVRGTNLMIDLMNNNSWKPSAKAKGNINRSQKEAETFVINKILIPIANLLGHKSGTGADLWRTTVKSYVEPEPLINWFNKKGLRIPKWLPKKADSAD